MQKIILYFFVAIVYSCGIREMRLDLLFDSFLTKILYDYGIVFDTDVEPYPWYGGTDCHFEMVWGQYRSKPSHLA